MIALAILFIGLLIYSILSWYRFTYEITDHDLRHQDGGYHIDHKKLIVRYRHLSRVTMIIYQHRLQAFEKKQHKLQATQKLATMRLSITGMLGIGTHYQLKDLDVEDVDRLGDWYSHQD